MAKTYDFCGWVTRNDLECSDGAIIRENAFAHQDGARVPLVWNHNHDDPEAVIGYTILENRPEGVYGYSYCNDSNKGRSAKIAVEHGDIDSYSIYANHLKRNSKDVLHGSIKEVSLVYSGANPGAYIEDVTIAHGEDIHTVEDEAIIYVGEELMYNNDEIEHADAQETSETTVGDVIESFTEEQKQVVAFLIGQAIQDAMGGSKKESTNSEVEHSDEDYEDYEDETVEEDIDDTIEHNDEGENDMKYNVFDNATRANTLAHADMKTLISDAKNHGGSFAEAAQDYLMHSEADAGIERAEDKQNYMVNDPSFLFPEARALTNTPEWIKRDTTWVDIVLRGVKHTPFARIKSMFADITEDEARAKGYTKGKRKIEEVFSLLKRTTTPQTIYKKQKMDRDDIIDITDFDVVAWIKGEMRMMLDEEIARAILIGDGRLASSDDKIFEDHIRPIYTDDPLFTIRKVVTAGTDKAGTTKNFIADAVRARKDYKGSGSPKLFTTEEWLTEALLLEDGIGHRMYKTEAELATAMRVSSIHTVPVMEGLAKDSKDCMGIIVNLADYTVGADKGGAVELFDDFDIDFNQFKYLIETRCSGALTKPFSAIVLETASASTQGQG